jgi:hypothetical protein
VKFGRSRLASGLPDPNLAAPNFTADVQKTSEVHQCHATSFTAEISMDVHLDERLMTGDFHGFPNDDPFHHGFLDFHLVVVGMA